jgi:hypothetical protein
MRRRCGDDAKMRRDGSAVAGEVRGGSEPTAAGCGDARVRLAAAVAEGAALLDLESTPR